MGMGCENKHLMILAVVPQSAVAQPEWPWGERHGEGSQSPGEAWLREQLLFSEDSYYFP